MRLGTWWPVVALVILEATLNLVAPGKLGGPW